MTMFLPEDFKYLRPKQRSKLQYFPTQAITQRRAFANLKANEPGYGQYFKGIVDEFVSCFSVHGMNRIFSGNLSKFKRTTWIVGFLVCLSAFFYVSFQVAHSYHTKPLMTVISDTHFPVFRIPFPEVTICNMNRFNWSRFQQAKELFMKPEHLAVPKYENLFEEVVNALDTLDYGKFYKFENITKVSIALLRELNYIDFEYVSDFMSWKCHEILFSCKWLNENLNCCDIFFYRYSQMGSCLAFNTVESWEGAEKQNQDPLWPWRAKDKGRPNGLRVMITEPSVWYNSPIEINTHAQTSISIKPTKFKYSNYTRIVPVETRQCLFENEFKNNSLPGRPYMLENCRSQCQVEYLVKFCNCSFTLFFPPGPFRTCLLADYPCLYYHHAKFRYFSESIGSKLVTTHTNNNVKCACYYNCESLIYYPRVDTAYMNNVKIDFNNSYVDLSIFYQREFLIELFTTVTYTLVDLMASFGGLAGLCIGCSLLSLVEIVYFFIVDIPRKSLLYYRTKKGLKWHKKSLKATTIIIENVLRN